MNPTERYATLATLCDCESCEQPATESILQSTEPDYCGAQLCYGHARLYDVRPGTPRGWTVADTSV